MKSMIKGLGCQGRVTLIVLGLLIIGKVIVDELEESVDVCRAKKIAIGAE